MPTWPKIFRVVSALACRVSNLIVNLKRLSCNALAPTLKGRKPFGLALVSLALWPQSNATDAALNSYVRDESGAFIPASKITARNLATNAEVVGAANQEGYFRFPLLRVGEYELRANAPGFSDYQQTGIRLTVGQQARVDVTLKVGTAADSVTVNADAALVTVGDVAQGEVLNERAVRTLPITSRNVYNFHLLGPGVKGIPSTGFGTTQFTFGGHNRSTWTIDGLDNSQRRTSRQIRLVISTPESVQEMQVLSGAYSAEFGRAAGGIINVISRSGANQMHGSSMGLYRPNAASARSPLAVRKADQSWWMVAGNLSGSLKRDQLFFFINDEFNPLKIPQPLLTSPTPSLAKRFIRPPPNSATTSTRKIAASCATTGSRTTSLAGAAASPPSAAA